MTKSSSFYSLISILNVSNTHPNILMNQGEYAWNFLSTNKNIIICACKKSTCMWCIVAWLFHLCKLLFMCLKFLFFLSTDVSYVFFVHMQLINWTGLKKLHGFCMMVPQKPWVPNSQRNKKFVHSNVWKSVKFISRDRTSAGTDFFRLFFYCIFNNTEFNKL